MKKLILVYNPRSSRHQAILEEVMTQARKVEGFLVGKFEVEKAGVMENAQRLAGMLEDGDLVVAAGGDGTATMTLNGVMLAEKEVTLGVLGYGHFNDMATTLGVKRAVQYGDEYIGGLEEIVAKFLTGESKEMYPLEVEVDGRFWRYAGCYVTMGMAAEVAKGFSGGKVRKALLGGQGRWRSYFEMAKWYFGNRGREFLGSAKVNGVEASDVTDVIAMNGLRMGHVLRGKGWQFEKAKFGAGEFRLGGLGRLFGFMMRGMFGRVPVKEVERLEVELTGGKKVVIQAEGEGEEFEGVEKVVIRKAGRGVRVVVGTSKE